MKSRSFLQSANQGVVSLLGLVISVEQERAVVGAPTVLVGDTPDGDTNTLGNGKTTVHDSQEVACCGAGDIELSDGNLLDIGASQCLEGVGDAGGWVPTARCGKMGLCANTVNGNALGHPLVNVCDHTSGNLGVVGNVQVVVVDVELGVGISGACGAESDTNKVFAEDTAEDAVSKLAVLGEDLVHDIPLQDLTLVVGDDLCHVVLDDGGQGSAVVDLRNPCWQLRVPEECVTTQELSVLGGPVDDVISVGECELST